ncbi:hypothetical protein J1605_003483 [Eschrichtius robustus]|uniref:Uncharacterized protein n=1 Tax=Eschrichtius robustus TaxID=9764 RepID=A0AB34HRC7_ESCRO|nr:hypothetical protein J1605_003483 [Eschrichtius robustus]
MESGLSCFAFVAILQEVQLVESGGGLV